MAEYTLYLVTKNAASHVISSVKRYDALENAGIDLIVPEEVTFSPGERKLVGMGVKGVMTKEGIASAPPLPVHYTMYPRSSLPKTGLVLCNSVGVIDRGYRGELKAFLWNTLPTSVTVSKGDRLVQIVAPDMGDIVKICVVPEEKAEALPFWASARGEGGFGSSGK